MSDRCNWNICIFHGEGMRSFIMSFDCLNYFLGMNSISSRETMDAEIWRVCIAGTRICEYAVLYRMNFPANILKDTLSLSFIFLSFPRNDALDSQSGSKTDLMSDIVLSLKWSPGWLFPNPAHVPSYFLLCRQHYARETSKSHSV